MTESLPQFNSAEEYIAHHGVKGMKWGRRKSRVSTSSSGKRAKTRNTSSDYEKMRRIAKKKPSQMTNRELQAYNNRKKLESTYRQSNPSKTKQTLDRMEAGRKNIKNIAATVTLASGATVSVVKFAQSPKGKALLSKAKTLFTTLWNAGSSAPAASNPYIRELL